MTLFELFFFFFRISAVTFGGGIVILGMVKLEEEKRRSIDPERFKDMQSIAVSMPGPIAVSFAWLFGRHYRGLRGSIAAVLGTITPPFLIVLLLSPFVLKYSSVPAVQGFFKGVLCGTGAIITYVVIDNVQSVLRSSYWNLLPLALIVAMIGLFKIHPLVAMAVVIALQSLKDRYCSQWFRS